MYRKELSAELIKQGLTLPQTTKIMELVDYARAETYEQGAITLYACALNILIEDFWPKTAARQIEKLNSFVWGLYGALKTGQVTTEDCAAYIKKASGIELMGQTVKLSSTGQWEKIETARTKKEEADVLLREVLTELNKTGVNKELAERIKAYLM